MTQYQWTCHPEAEKLLINALEKCAQSNPEIAKLQDELLQKTSTRLFDWLDHLILGYSQELEEKVEALGFVSEEVTSNYRVYRHPGAQLPRIVVKEGYSGPLGAAVAVESIAQYLMTRGLSGEIEGTPFAEYRRCCLSTEKGVSLLIVERRCSHLMEPFEHPPSYVQNYLLARELWQTRARQMQDEEEAMAHTLALASRIKGLVGEDLAAWIVLEVEREYWQAHNKAGQIQKNRQDGLGMGWANHDHHTFRSSRRHFGQLVKLFEMLGFYCRERFYAGDEAGWGAQVMEHPRTRLVLFLDVDLDPHEIQIDFRHQPLSERKKLSTVGLWCALHGESILGAGMHHLEAQFMFDELKEDLSEIGVGMMDPFSNFPFLKQAFTKGEFWRVDPERVDRLLSAGSITKEQAEKFRTQGAIGSHMENLQRREGYKGFNQRNVSTIIQKTDPRNINF